MVPAEFDVIPALDVRAGRLARMPGGDPDRLQPLAGDPMSVASVYVKAGARWIHLVDLDAVLEGRPANLDVLARVASLPVSVQAGGGLSPEGVALALARGAARAVLGAAVLSDPDAARSAVEAYGDRVGMAIDVRGGAVAPRGTRTPGPSLDAALEVVAAVAPSFVTYTNVERDGTGAGPDLDGLARVAAATRVPVIASGGVRSLEDLRALAALAPAVRGAIVGRALQEGAFTLAEALAATSGR